MSILHTIEVDIEKFFKGTGTDLEKFAAGFVKLFKKAPTALQAVENFTGEVALVIEAAVGLADPALEAPLAAALATVETGLAAIQASATAAVSGNSLLADLQNFFQTVPSLLTGIAVKNPVLQGTVTRLVNLVVSECKVLIPAVESWVKQLASATAVQGAAGIGGTASAATQGSTAPAPASATTTQAAATPPAAKVTPAASSAP